MAAEGDIDVDNLVETTVQHPVFRETINSILMATNQEQTTNIANVETNQINRNNLSNIPSAGATNNSSSKAVTNR